MFRSEERESAFRLIFSFLVNPDGDSNIPESEYIIETLNGVKENREELEKKIKDTLEKWSFTELGNVEKALLFLSFYEIMFSKLDYRIVTNEVVELAKKYGNENASKFVNGALAKLINKN